LSFDIRDLLDMEVPTSALMIVAFALAVSSAALFVALVKINRRSELFTSTSDKASVGLVHVSMDGTWLRLNDKMSEITGYSRDELIGRYFSDITLEADVPKNQSLNNRLRTGEIDSYILEKRYRRKDGNIIWVKLSVALVRRRDGTPDYYVSVVEDIDQLKQAQCALQEQEARFRAFWDNSPFNQSLKDPQGRLVEVNPTYLATFGIKEENVGGKTLTQAHGTAWGSHVDDFDREVLRTLTTRTSDITVPGKDQQDTLMRVTKFPSTTGKVVSSASAACPMTSTARSTPEWHKMPQTAAAATAHLLRGSAHPAGRHFP
jgi:PAS domain S-box-containing protein